MKKIKYTCKTPFLLTFFLFITLSLSGFVSFSQTTTVSIPDANFRAALISKSGISAGSGTNVTVNDISSITSLDISGQNISSLTGIEAFTALTRLSCSTNQLTSLDVSANTALTWLHCDSNQLTSLNVKNRNNINFRETSFLIHIGVLDPIADAFSVINNPNLTCIQVDDAMWSTTNWPNKDATASFSVNCATVGNDDFEKMGLRPLQNPREI